MQWRRGFSEQPPNQLALRCDPSGLKFFDLSLDSSWGMTSDHTCETGSKVRNQIEQRSAQINFTGLQLKLRHQKLDAIVKLALRPGSQRQMAWRFTHQIVEGDRIWRAFFQCSQLSKAKQAHRRTHTANDNFGWDLLQSRVEVRTNPSALRDQYEFRL